MACQTYRVSHLIVDWIGFLHDFSCAVGNMAKAATQIVLDLEIHSSPHVRSTFVRMKIDHKSGLTLYPGYRLV